MKNSRSNYFRELTGVRVVSMYVQEFFHWGWQKTDQENDDGIDGFIIIRSRSGKDLGAMIKVQIKCGPSYLSSRINDEAVRISPFDSKSAFESHLNSYSKSTCPVILVWVNTRKKGLKVDDLYHPEVWWRRVDDYKYNDESVITLDKKLGEHSKGDLFSLVKGHIKDWTGYPSIILKGDYKHYFYSDQLKQDALSFYRKWRNWDTFLHYQGKSFLVKKSRLGWRHINYKKRGQERISTSLRLLPLVDEIISEFNGRPILLNSKLLGDHVLCEKYGIRCLVIVKDITMKVQVVLIKRINQMNDSASWEFYSLHEIK